MPLPARGMFLIAYGILSVGSYGIHPVSLGHWWDGLWRLPTMSQTE
jgi:hypothetical protein